MTYEEAIKWFEDNMPEPEGYAYREAIKALEEAVKYQWHNLKESPNDLPTEEGIVLVSLNGEYRPEGRNYGTTFTHAVDMIYWVNDGKFYADPEEWMNEFVEAWKYPDQFKEE